MQEMAEQAYLSRSTPSWPNFSLHGQKRKRVRGPNHSVFFLSFRARTARQRVRGKRAHCGVLHVRPFSPLKLFSSARLSTDPPELSDVVGVGHRGHWHELLDERIRLFHQSLARRNLLWEHAAWLARLGKGFCIRSRDGNALARRHRRAGALQLIRRARHVQLVPCLLERVEQGAEARVRPALYVILLLERRRRQLGVRLRRLDGRVELLRQVRCACV